MWPCFHDKLREECGIFGLFNHKNACFFTLRALQELQHRGQDSVGIAYHLHNQVFFQKSLGLVGDFVSRFSYLKENPSCHAAIGHTRYATTGKSILSNAQPLYATLSTGPIALAHNGNFSNAAPLRRLLSKKGAKFQTSSDTELIFHLMEASSAKSAFMRFQSALKQLEGGFSVLALTAGQLFAARDPIGIRPLIMGRLNDAPIFSSESCVFNAIEATYVREVENGEVILCEAKSKKQSKIFSFLPKHKPEARLCLFEYIYFSRPDSILSGQPLYQIRKKIGNFLAQEAPSPNSLIVPIPNSGSLFAAGYAQSAQQRLVEALVPTPYSYRTFIEPTKAARFSKAALKYTIKPHSIYKQNITLIDDSLVRGTTAFVLIKKLREAGAQEIHLRIASPRVLYPDFFGLAIATKEELCAHHYKKTKEIASYLNVDSIKFLSLNTLYQAICGQKRNPHKPQFTDHYFTGNYPLTVKG